MPSSRRSTQPRDQTQVSCITGAQILYCLSHQGISVYPDNRMGKSRDLKKIRDNKGTFRAKMGSIKDRNCMDLREAEAIKKRWQEYTEELYKKDFSDLDNYDVVITHLEKTSWSEKSSGP